MKNPPPAADPRGSPCPAGPASSKARRPLLERDAGYLFAVHPGLLILCIDTWLGALEFWTDQNDPERYQSLNLRNGYPTVYYQFLANVCHKGFHETIVPFPQTSSNAALWLRTHGITSDLIYLVASHEEEDVYEDLCRYWEVVSDNSVVFGDDYTWVGVRLAVDRFTGEEPRKISFIADKWVLRKS